VPWDGQHGGVSSPPHPSSCQVSSFALLWDYKEATYSGTTEEAEDSQSPKLWELGEVSKKGEEKFILLQNLTRHMPTQQQTPFCPRWIGSALFNSVVD